MKPHQALIGNNKNAVVTVCLNNLGKLFNAARTFDKLRFFPIKEIDRNAENALIGSAIHFKKC